MEQKSRWIKVTGRLRRLKDLTKKGSTLPGTVGISHTRWATHGSPSDTNAHPHFNKDQLDHLFVHNGIIGNYSKLKQRLIGKGYEFVSETDTEVLAHLLDYYYKRDHNPLEGAHQGYAEGGGSYALGIPLQRLSGPGLLCQEEQSADCRPQRKAVISSPPMSRHSSVYKGKFLYGERRNCRSQP